MMKHMILSTAVLMGIAGTLPLSGCSTEPKGETAQSDLRTDAQNALNKAQAADPSLKQVLSSAAGYAVFPKVGKAAVGIGGAYGRGVLYEGGAWVGYCDMTQANFGIALGGQTFTQIIAFETPQALAKFKTGNFAFDAAATAVALKSGAGATAKYTDGVSVFVTNESGLMAAASLGGQKFSFTPK